MFGGICQIEASKISAKALGLGANLRHGQIQGFGRSFEITKMLLKILGLSGT